MNSDENNAFRKLALLSKAIQIADDELDELDNMDEDEFEDCLKEFKASAFEALLLNPGSEYGDWEQELIHNYATEVVDCYGSDPFEAFASLRDLWESEYDDPASGLCMDYQDWALAFATEQSRDLYYAIVELKKQQK